MTMLSVAEELICRWLRDLIRLLDVDRWSTSLCNDLRQRYTKKHQVYQLWTKYVNIIDFQMEFKMFLLLAFILSTFEIVQIINENTVKFWYWWDSITALDRISKFKADLDKSELMEIELWCFGGLVKLLEESYN